jgi:hypothetical protein
LKNERFETLKDNLNLRKEPIKAYLYVYLYFHLAFLNSYFNDDKACFAEELRFIS